MAIVAEKRADGQFPEPRLTTFDSPTDLPAPGGDVLVRVSWSSLNYKDALAVTGRGQILRQFPIVPGIDLAGVIEANGGDPRFHPGDPVILTGCHYGEKHSGGFAEIARVNGDALVRLPEGMSPQQAMILGTAGFTAMQCVLALEAHGLKPAADHPVLVTGATGGVGSLAVILLSQLGYHVVAATGRADTEGDWLRQLGASEVLPRETLNAHPTRALETARWAGVIDTVGGDTLASALRQTQEGGSVAACGLAGGQQLHTTVFPFILRGVNLLGINSVTCPMPIRQAIWSRWAKEMNPSKLNQIARPITLTKVPDYARELLAGRLRGRVVVQVSPES